MHFLLFAAAAALAGVLHVLANLDVAQAVELQGRRGKITEREKQFIVRVFADAAPEAGVPQIATYQKGAYVANAARGRVRVEVRRTAEGVVTAAYTVSGDKAARGVATADRFGNGSNQTVFGPAGDRSAEYAASRLARSLAPPLP